MNFNIKKVTNYFVVYLLLTTLFCQGQTVINNNKLRFGNGTQNSINTSGLLEQPFYQNPTEGWRKLTYSTYPLDIRYGIDGIGTTNWNLNGTIVENPGLTNINYDYSGLTNTTGNNYYGVAKVIGNITINGKLFQVENTYTLLENEGYIKMRIKLTNKSGGTVNNVRVWYGTRDDYVGGTDDPTKERGNLVNNQFQIISSSSQQSNVLKIKTTDEAILFFSNSPRAYTSIADCCHFSYATESNPLTNIITDIEDDGSYAMYTRFNDLENNQSDEVEIYYAAGTLPEIDEIIETVANASKVIIDITEDSAKMIYNVSENGVSNYIMVPQGSAVPTIPQIVAGVDYSGVTVIKNGSLNSVSDVPDTTQISGLIANTSYTFYGVTLYNNGVNNVYTPIKIADFTTLPNDIPTGSTIPDQTFCINTTLLNIPITVADNYPTGGNISLTGTSNNLTLLTNSGITFGGSGANRTINISPEIGESGTTEVTINIQDDLGGIGNQSFNITVFPYGGSCTPPSVLINPHTTIQTK